MFKQPRTRNAAGDAARRSHELMLALSGVMSYGGSVAFAVARVHAGFLDVLHDAGDVARPRRRHSASTSNS